MKESMIEQRVYAELRKIGAAIKALQARIDYVLEDLREYRKRESRDPDDDRHIYPEWHP